jgi:hypothetical protein
MPLIQNSKVTVTRSLATFYTPGKKNLTAKFLFSAILQAQTTPQVRLDTTHLHAESRQHISNISLQMYHPWFELKTFVIDMMV